MIETKRPASATMSTDWSACTSPSRRTKRLLSPTTSTAAPGGASGVADGRRRAHQRSSLWVERCQGITSRSMMTTIRNSASVSSMVISTAPNTRSVRKALRICCM